MPSLILQANGEKLSLIDDLLRVCARARLNAVELALWRRGRIERLTVPLDRLRPASR